MSDSKRKRYRKNKDERQRPIVLAKREESSGGVSFKAEMEMQPKILLKTKHEQKENKEARDEALSLAEITSGRDHPPLKTIIVTRNDVVQSPGLSGSPNITKELATQVDGNAAIGVQANVLEPVPFMTRPATVISSTGLINSSARKLLMKTNNDFLVVGVIGTQGVGKSTIMNLLANEQPGFDYYQKVFVEQDSVFPTKLKLHKCSARSRTESTHMFITPDRTILLDSPPVLCNSYKKDMITNELDDLRNIISFLSVCHLLIVVQDDYINMSFMRLLQFAELMKPTQDNKSLSSDYFPNLLFIKNRAKRQDYITDQKTRMDCILKEFFKDSQMRIYIGQTVGDHHVGPLATQQRSKKCRAPETERVVNCFLFPEVSGPNATPYHAPLDDIVDQLRTLIFMTPRNSMYSGPAELTEFIWFELLTKASLDTQHFFFNTYEDIQRKHLEVGNNETRSGAGSNSVGNSGKDTHENWRE